MIIVMPESLREMFEIGEAEYRFINYKYDDMNNNESMRWFVNYVDISTDNIVEDFGTEIILQHEDFNFKLAVDSHGLGDFYSHAFVVSIVD